MVGGFCSHGTELCDPVGGDTEPPSYVQGTPATRNIIDKSFELDVALSENGVFSWVLLDRDAPAPNSLEVILGTGANNAEPLQSGEVAVLIADHIYSDFMGGLTANTAYDLYVAANDNNGNPTPTSTLVQVITDIDRYAPQFVTGFPAATAITHGSFSFDVRLDEIGTVHYVVLPADASPPLAHHIAEGTVTDETVFASGSFDVAAILTTTRDHVESAAFDPSTSVSVFAVAKDALDNVSPTPTRLDVTLIADAVPPIFQDSFPRVESIADSSTEVAVQLDEVGRFFAIIVPAGTLEPSPLSLRSSAIQGASGNVLAAGVEDVPARLQTARTLLGGLSASTDYAAYVVSEDAFGNLGPVSRLDFRTLPDATAPVWLESPPLWIEDLRDISLSCTTRLDEAGTVFVVALPSGSSVPTPSAIRDSPDVNTGSVLQGAQTFSIPVTALQPESEYSVFAVAADSSGNLQPQGLVQEVSVTTLAAVAQVSEGPSVVDVAEDSGVIQLSLTSGDATVFLVVVEAGGNPPSAEAIQAGVAVGTVQAASSSAPNANEVVSIAVSGLQIATAYDVWVTTANSDGLLLLQPTLVSFVTAGDVEYPDFISGYPRFATIRDTSVTIQVKLSEPGMVSYVILPDGTAGPTVEGVYGRTAGGAVAVGTIAVSDANALAVAQGVGGLVALRQYDAYFVAEDATGNLQPVPTLVEFATTADVTAPSAVVGYPRITSVTQASAQLTARVDEDATMFVVVQLASSQSPPTAAEVVAAVGSDTISASLVLEGRETGAVALTGLAPLTEYVAYIVYVDLLGNTSPVGQLAFTTSEDVGPPDFVDNFPRVVDIAETGAAVEVKTTEPGRFFYVVVPHHHATPIATSVRDASGRNILAFGSGNLADPTTIGSSAFAGLEPDTEYDLYVVAQDSVLNLQLVAHVIEFRTLPDATAPLIAPGYPLVTSVLDRSADLNVKADDDAVWHVAVLHASAPVPTAAQVEGLSAVGANLDPVAYATVTSAAHSISAVSVFGLQPATDYMMYVVAADQLGNFLPNAVAVPLTTAEDTFPPIFVSPYPDVSGITENYITTAAAVNERSIIHWIVVPNAAAAPSAADIIAVTTSAVGAVDTDFYSDLSVDPTEGSDPARVTLASGWIAYEDVGSVLSFDVATGPLESETAYDLYVVAIDTKRQAATPVRLDITTVLDYDPPVNAAGFPRATNVVDRSVVIEHKTNEHGRFFAVAVADGAPAPTMANVVAGTGFNAAVAIASGGARLTANQVATTTLYNLDPETVYNVYVVAEDWAANFQSTPVKIIVETLRDTHAPGFVAPTPEFAGATESFVSIRLVLNEHGAVHYVVLPAGHPDIPTVEDVVGGGSEAGATIESGVALVGTAGASIFLRVPTDKLDDNEDYDVYVVALDPAGHHSPRGIVLVRTIVDDTPPVFRVGYPSVSAVSARSADIDILLSERASIRYVVTAAGPAQRPTVQEVLAGTAGGGQAALIAGNAFVRDADSLLTFTLNYLQETTSYDAFVVAMDSKGNIRNSPAVLRFTTLPDFDPPVVSSASAEDVTDSSWTFRVTVNEAGSFYWIVVPSGAAPPDADQILSGKTATDEVPTDAGVFEIGDQHAGIPFHHPVVVFTRPDTNYDIYYVVVDRAADPNVGSVGLIEVRTTGDVSPPRYLDGFPLISNVGSTTAVLESKYSEDCEVYWVVTNAPFANQPVPLASADEVKLGHVSGTFLADDGEALDGEDGQDGESDDFGGNPSASAPTIVAAGSGPAVGRIATNVQLSGLFSLSQYVVYTAAEDRAGNLMADGGVRILTFETGSSGTSAQAAQTVGLFGQGDTGTMDFAFLIIGVIVLLLLVLCCCLLGRRKKKYTYLETDGKVTPDGDVIGWDGPDGDRYSDGSGGWAPVERASRDGWGRRGSGGSGIDLSEVTGELDDELIAGPIKKHAGAPGMNLAPLGGAAGSGAFELNRTPVLGGDDAAARRSFVNREMMDLDMVLREAEDVSTSVMNRAPEMVEDIDGSGEVVGAAGSAFSSSVYTEETTSEAVYSSEVRSSEVRSSEVRSTEVRSEQRTSGEASGTIATSSSQATSSYK